jgi:predicted DNA-binding transcriptional regulator AlpA
MELEMKMIATVQGTAQKPQYARAKSACAHFGISRSTLWQWCKTRKGFPIPLRAGPKVTLFDLAAIDSFIKADAAK